MYLSADISKLKKDTNFKIKYIFNEGIKKTIKWHELEKKLIGISNMEKKVSIIIPTYNLIKERKNDKIFLDKTLNSLKKQTLKFDSLEIIIVDDNSNNLTKDFLKKINENYNNINVIFLEENSGSPSKPRNLGIKHATSDYIMFLDQDDYFTEKACEVMYNIINQRNADIVSTNYIIEMNEQYVAFNENESYKEFNPKHSLSKFQKQYAPWARIFRKSLLNNINLPDNILMEDSFMNFNAFLEAEKVIYLNDFFSYIYCVNNESITLNSKYDTIIKGFNGIKEIIGMLKKYPENIPLIIDDLFSMLLQTLLMFNFSLSDNIKLLKKFKILEDQIIEENKNVYTIMSKPLWAKFLNFFIKHGLFIISALITKVVQKILNNESIKKKIFTKLYKHELYYEKNNNTYGY